MFFLPVPKTIDEMKMVLTLANNGESQGFDDVKWFCAYHMASSLVDCTTKDVARSIIGGDLTMKTEADVQEYIASFTEDEEEVNIFDEDYDEECDMSLYFWKFLCSFFDIEISE